MTANDKMILTEEQTEDLQNLAAAAAQRVAKQWPVTVQKDDLEQDIIVRLLESPGALARLFEEPDRQVRQSFLIKMGHQLASEAQTEYDEFSGNHLYDAAFVRGLLDRQVWLLEDKQSVEKLDLEEGLSILANKNSTYYAAIENRFVHDIIPDDAGRMRVGRAVESLTEIMNRIGEERQRSYIGGPGSRKAISNVRAASVTESSLNGE